MKHVQKVGTLKNKNFEFYDVIYEWLLGPLTEEDELNVCDPSYVNSYKNVFSITTKLEAVRYM